MPQSTDLSRHVRIVTATARMTRRCLKILKAAWTVTAMRIFSNEQGSGIRADRRIFSFTEILNNRADSGSANTGGVNRHEEVD